MGVPNILLPKALVKRKSTEVDRQGSGIDNQGRLRLYQEVMEGVVLITDKRFVKLFELLIPLNLKDETMTTIYDLVLKEVDLNDTSD